MRNLDDVLLSKTQQFAHIPEKVFGRNISSSLVRTLCVLLWLADGKPAVSTSYMAISKFTGKAIETERRIVRQLVQSDLLTSDKSETGWGSIAFQFERRVPLVRTRFPIELVDPKFKLSDVEFRILLSCYKICGRFDETKISMEMLTEQANTNSESARKALRALEDHDLLKVERTKRNFGMLSMNKIVLNCTYEKSMREIRTSSKRAKGQFG